MQMWQLAEMYKGRINEEWNVASQIIYVLVSLLGDKKKMGRITPDSFHPMRRKIEPQISFTDMIKREIELSRNNSNARAAAQNSRQSKD